MGPRADEPSEPVCDGDIGLLEDAALLGLSSVSLCYRVYCYEANILGVGVSANGKPPSLHHRARRYSSHKNIPKGIQCQPLIHTMSRLIKCLVIANAFSCIIGFLDRQYYPHGRAPRRLNPGVPLQGPPGWWGLY